MLEDWCTTINCLNIIYPLPLAIPSRIARLYAA
nr:MAG TPA: hypothetical protein [Caudoviricetes sp.]